VWFSSPTFATIDGVRAVVAAALNGRVYVLNAVTHQPLPGWRDGVQAIMKGSAPTAIESSPAVAYLDGPGKPPSIIVGTGSEWSYFKDQNGGLIAFNANGTVRFVVHTSASFNQWGPGCQNCWDNSVFGTPAVGDFEGNGQLDIAFTSFDHHIYVVNSHGQLLPGFPIARVDTIWSSPMLADTSHTGRDDLIVGGDSSGLKDLQGHSCYGGWITDYRWTGSGPKLEWEHCVGETIWSSPTIGVLNSTGREAIVVGTSFAFQNPSYLRTAAAHEIFAWYADNGDPVPGWPVDAGGTCNDPSQFPAGGTFGSPAIAQITPSGGPVVISTSHAHCLKGPAVVSEWSGSGHKNWSTVINASNDVDSSPAVVDMGGSGVNDVVVGSADGMLILNGETGAVMDNTNARPLQGGCDVAGAPAVSPVKGFGSSGWEMVFACGGPVRPGTLAAYALPKAPLHPPAWAEWRANPDRSGVPDPLGAPSKACSVPSSPRGYRLVTADGQEITGFGTLPGCGDARSDVLPVPVAGEAATPDGGGYWILLQDGTVYSFGNAHWYGDARTGTYHANSGLAPPGAPMTGIASTRDGKGYYLTDGFGDVYAFGDATYRGSRSGQSIDGTVVGITTDMASGGYWLYTSKGQIYAFGAAPNHGSAASRTLKTPVVAMAAPPDGHGYWLVTRVGTVFAYGIRGDGSIAKMKHQPVVGMAAGAGGKGYYLFASDGGVFALGTKFWGSGVGVKHLHDESIVGASGL
jgi:hypothetical protein